MIPEKFTCPDPIFRDGFTKRKLRAWRQRIGIQVAAPPEQTFRGVEIRSARRMHSRSRLGRKLTPAEILEAEDQARTWLQTHDNRYMILR